MKKYLKIITIAIIALLFLLSNLITKEITQVNQRPILLGDINNDGIIDRNDIDLIHQHLLQVSELDENQKVRADINQDEEINLIDLFRINKYIGGV